MQLGVTHIEKLFSDLFHEIDMVQDQELILELLTKEEKYQINLILRRIRLTDNLRREEVFTYVNDGIGIFDEAALRLHLYLTCFELLGRLIRESKFLTFENWINAKKEPYISEKEIILSETIQQEEIVEEYLNKYNSLHGIKTHFFAFISEGLSTEDQDWLLQNCWVVQANPLPLVHTLGMVFQDSRNEGNGVIGIAIEAKQKWLSYDRQKKLKLIANALFKCRNLYTHSLKPYTSVQDKTPEKHDNIHVLRGDDIYIWEENMVISFVNKPSTFYLRQLLILALKQLIIKKKESNNK